MRDLRELEIGAHSSIGQWNWITAARPFVESPTATRVTGCLTMGDHSAITSRHYIDCSGGVNVGAFTTVAGVKSTLLSHQIDVSSSRQTVRPLDIGPYCFVGSDVRITPGSTIPEKCVIAMGAVVAGDLREPGMLYAGVPARPIKPVGDGAWFDRTTGFVQVD